MKELVDLQKLAKKRVPGNNDTISTDSCTVTTNVNFFINDQLFLI